MILEDRSLAGGGLISLAEIVGLWGAYGQGTELLSVGIVQIVTSTSRSFPRITRTGCCATATFSSRGSSPLTFIQDVRHAVSADVPSHGSHDAAGAGKWQLRASQIQLRQN